MVPIVKFDNIFLEFSLNLFSNTINYKGDICCEKTQTT